jgi:hypothetical protein
MGSQNTKLQGEDVKDVNSGRAALKLMTEGTEKVRQ